MLDPHALILFSRSMTITHLQDANSLRGGELELYLYFARFRDDDRLALRIKLAQDLGVVVCVGFEVFGQLSCRKIWPANFLARASRARSTSWQSPWP
jgi:hypothetical protein